MIELSNITKIKNENKNIKNENKNILNDLYNLTQKNKLLQKKNIKLYNINKILNQNIKIYFIEISKTYKNNLLKYSYFNSYLKKFD